MELESSTVDQREETVVQLVDEIAQAVEKEIETCVVVQRQTKVGFFLISRRGE